MASPALQEVPASLKGILPYLKLAFEHDERDPVISYWVRFYVAQTGLKLTKKKTQEETNFLVKLMTWLESTKKTMHDNEAITNEVAAQAHIENWALKLFLIADSNDRACNFSKKVVQNFFTASLLYDVLMVFGELSDEATQNRKYARWKASYIHNCLKNGETPIPGPFDPNNDGSAVNQSEDASEEPAEVETQSDDNPVSESDNEEEEAPAPAPAPSPPADPYGLPSVPTNSSNSDGNFTPFVNPHPYNPASTPTTPPVFEISQPPPTAVGSVALTPEQMIKAQKYIKWAGSAINYDDIPTSVDNLQKALRLLTTGQDS